MNEDIHPLLKDLHASLCIRFGSTAPYRIGRVSAERVGFAQDPCLTLNVMVRDEDLSSVVPIVRQAVYRELAERGWTPDDIAFTPSTMRGRRRKFIDGNESSQSYGRHKFGTEYAFRFHMERELAATTFVGFGSFRSLPTRGEPNARQ